MARKYDLISELYRRTAHAVVSDVQNWQAFLRCACRNYRLRFDEQLLIYAALERQIRALGKPWRKGYRRI